MTCWSLPRRDRASVFRVGRCPPSTSSTSYVTKTSKSARTDARILNPLTFQVEEIHPSITLSLKTAARRPSTSVQNLEHTIKVGNSLVGDPSVTDAPFVWETAFPKVFQAGGFDVVIGNPPYVRMEYLKPVKPYLAKTYDVAADRADLYAYFFERGAGLLKPGGRLGYISSSTFFRTGSGGRTSAPSCPSACASNASSTSRTRRSSRA